MLGGSATTERTPAPYLSRVMPLSPGCTARQTALGVRTLALLLSASALCASVYCTSPRETTGSTGRTLEESLPVGKEVSVLAAFETLEGVVDENEGRRGSVLLTAECQVDGDQVSLRLFRDPTRLHDYSVGTVRTGSGSPPHVEREATDMPREELVRFLSRVSQCKRIQFYLDGPSVLTVQLTPLGRVDSVSHVPIATTGAPDDKR